MCFTCILHEQVGLSDLYLIGALNSADENAEKSEENAEEEDEEDMSWGPLTPHLDDFFDNPFLKDC